MVSPSVIFGNVKGFTAKVHDDEENFLSGKLKESLHSLTFSSHFLRSKLAVTLRSLRKFLKPFRACSTGTCTWWCWWKSIGFSLSLWWKMLLIACKWLCVWMGNKSLAVCAWKWIFSFSFSFHKSEDCAEQLQVFLSDIRVNHNKSRIYPKNRSRKFSSKQRKFWCTANCCYFSVTIKIKAKSLVCVIELPIGFSHKPRRTFDESKIILHKGSQHKPKVT